MIVKPIANPVSKKNYFLKYALCWI